MASSLVREYDPAWPGRFVELRARALGALGEVALAVEHVGSTAVPGLPGKDVIDLDVVVRSPADVPVAEARLEAIGYDASGRKLAIPGLAALGWPESDPRHHLYVVVAGSRIARQRTLLRDYLRAHPLEAARYARVKRALARRHPHDLDAYAAAKSPFVEELVAAAERDAAGAS